MRPRATWGARSELERLLAVNTRDTQLLQQLSKLSEEEGDFESAARYQKLLTELAPSDDDATRLAQLYSRYGELEEAQVVWSKMAAGKSEAHRIFQAIDNLLSQKKAPAGDGSHRVYAAQGSARLGGALSAGAGAIGSAKARGRVLRFQAILDLPISDDEKSALCKGVVPRSEAQAGGSRSTSAAFGQQSMIPLQDRISQLLQIRTACKIENSSERCQPAGDDLGSGDFGQARMATLGWLLSLAQKGGSGQKR